MMDGKNAWHRRGEALTAEAWHHELCMNRFDDATLDGTGITFWRGPSNASGRIIQGVLHANASCWSLQNVSSKAVPTTPETYSLRELGDENTELGSMCSSCCTLADTIPLVRRTNLQVGYEGILELVRKQVDYMPGKIQRARSANGRLALQNEVRETAANLRAFDTTGVTPEQIDERDRLLAKLVRLDGDAADAPHRSGNVLSDVANQKVRAELCAGDALLDEKTVIGAGTVAALNTGTLANLIIETYTVSQYENKVVLRCPVFVWMWLLGRERRRKGRTGSTAWPDDGYDDTVLATAVVLYDPAPTAELRSIGAALEAASLLHS